MGTYNIHAGHAPSNSGGASGAVGILNESNEARKVKDQVIIAMRNQGHTVYDCTCDQGFSQNGVLRDIVSKCNTHAVDLDISIHFNAGGGKGIEVWCYDNGTSAVASRICNAIASLGFANRGVKYSKQLYVLSNTKSPAILIECCFVDSAEDAGRYNADAMANAIVTGICGVITPSVPTSKYPIAYNTHLVGMGYTDAKVDGEFIGDKDGKVAIDGIHIDTRRLPQGMQLKASVVSGGKLKDYGIINNNTLLGVANVADKIEQLEFTSINPPSGYDFWYRLYFDGKPMQWTNRKIGTVNTNMKLTGLQFRVCKLSELVN